MKAYWFEPMIKSWIPDVIWIKKEIKKVCNLLVLIAKTSCGEIIIDSQINKNLFREYAQRRVEQILDRGVTEFVKNHLQLCIIKEIKKPIKQITSNDCLPFIKLKYVQRSCDEKGNLNTFISNPSFKNFIRWQINWKQGMPLQNTTINLIKKQLTKIINNIDVSSYKNQSRIGWILSSEIDSTSKMLSKVHKIRENSFKQNTIGTLIMDDQYPKFISSLLRCAKKSIYIIMFFMSYQEKKSSSTKPLIQELIKSQRRGVNIQVILDKDAEGEVYGSRIINSYAYKEFLKNGIKVCYDDEEEVTHTKLVIVDCRHIVIGSHNWTSGSFKSYDDTSIYIDSDIIAKDYISDFEKRWKHYSHR